MWVVPIFVPSGFFVLTVFDCSKIFLFGCKISLYWSKSFRCGSTRIFHWLKIFCLRHTTFRRQVVERQFSHCLSVGQPLPFPMLLVSCRVLVLGRLGKLAAVLFFRIHSCMLHLISLSLLISFVGALVRGKAGVPIVASSSLLSDCEFIYLHLIPLSVLLMMMMLIRSSSWSLSMVVALLPLVELVGVRPGE